MEVLERFDRINRVKLSVVEILDDILYRAAVKRSVGGECGIGLPHRVRMLGVDVDACEVLRSRG